MFNARASPIRPRADGSPLYSSELRRAEMSQDVLPYLVLVGHPLHYRVALHVFPQQKPSLGSVGATGRGDPAKAP